MKDTLDGLKYRREHLSCENYAANDCSIWGTMTLKAGKSAFREGVECPTLIFVLTGELAVSSAQSINQRVTAGHMFLVPAGDNFYGSAITDAVLMRCAVIRDASLCNKFAIEQLQEYAPLIPEPENEIVLLPIHRLLFNELEATRNLLNAGLACIHFQRFKMDILFIGLRGFYTKEELAALFMPILGKDNDFKNKVMQLYPQVNTAKELIDRMNMSPTGFKRKFQESFGTSAKQWLIRKKKEKLLRDIVMTNMSIAELAEKYNFTVNYLTTFCKEHFGKSPTGLRAQAF